LENFIFEKKKKVKKKFKKFFFLNFLEKVLFCCIWDKTDQSCFLNERGSKTGFFKSVSVNGHMATFELKTVAVDCPVYKSIDLYIFVLLKIVIQKCIKNGKKLIINNQFQEI
jgi:hypothetical protein